MNKIVEWMTLWGLLNTPVSQIDLQRKFQNVLAPTIKIESEIDEKLLSPSLKLAKGVKFSIFKLKQVSQNSIAVICLWGLDQGEDFSLGLVPLQINKTCRESVAAEPIAVLKMKKVKSISVVYEKMKKIRIEVEGQATQDFELPFVASQNQNAYERYSGNIKWKGIQGIILESPVELSNDRESLTSADGLYSESRLIKCHEMNSQCEEVMAFSCDECAGAWIEVFDRSCALGGTKYCASEKCGEKGEPACLLGSDWLSPDIDPICTKEDQRVFCRPKFVQFCDPDGVAICL
ncbi:MAG: hypothetical protein Fur0010_08660 [Bdellovibrio sp.]